MTARARRCGEAVLFGVVPALLLVVVVAAVVSEGRTGSDFGTFWEAARAVLHGRSPYPDVASLPHVAGPKFAPYVYPPVAAVSLVPLGVLPYTLAALVFLGLGLAAVAAALLLLEVRDWRCYGAAFASAPVFAAGGLGTVSPFLLLAVAAAWRHRDRALVCGLCVAYLVSAKLFLWPVWLWLLRTRRFRAAAVAAGSAAAAVLGSWALIGFAGLHEYPRLLGRLTGLVGPHSYSSYALGRALGLGGGAAQLAVYAVGALALAAAARRRADDRALLTAALGLSLLLTPILWPHYLVLVLVPIALARPTLSPLWLAPLALWADCTARSHDSPLRIGAALALAGLLLAAAVRPRPRTPLTALPVS